jgi:hypothetical protein
MQRKAALTITGVTRHQYYYKPKAGRGGRPRTCCTQKLYEGVVVCVPDSEVIARIHELKSDPDTDHGYHKTARRLMLDGY